VALALILSAGVFAAGIVRAQTMADMSARELARGATPNSMRLRLESDGLRLSSVERQPGLVCAHLSGTKAETADAVQGVFKLIPLAISARACAVVEPT
jgi:hypothetical protein